MKLFWKILLLNLSVILFCFKQERIIRDFHFLKFIPLTGTSTKTLVDGNNITEKLLGMQICNTAGTSLYSNNTDYNNLRLSNNGSRWMLNYGLESGSMYGFKVKLSVNQTLITSIIECNGENWEAVTGKSSLITIGSWDKKDNSATSGYDPWGGLSPMTINHGGSICTLMWAPRNAGYDKNHKCGLLYQWHRHFGQTYNETGFVETPFATLVMGGVTLAQGSDALNRNIFYYQYAVNNDWCTTSETSWSSSSAYNLYPPGWRVPTGAEITALKNSGSTWINSGSGGIDELPGRWYDGNHSIDHLGSVLITVSGKRIPTGIYNKRNSYCHYLISSASGTNGVDLFMNSETSSFDASYMAYGYSIRCVKSVE